MLAQPLKVVDMWTESLESGGQIDVVYTDLEKAFDKVSHKRLISKLYSYAGIGSRSVNSLSVYKRVYNFVQITDIETLGLESLDPSYPIGLDWIIFYHTRPGFRHRVTFFI